MSADVRLRRDRAGACAGASAGRVIDILGCKMETRSQELPDSPLPPAPRRMRLLAVLGVIVSGVLSYVVFRLVLPGSSGRYYFIWLVLAPVAVYWRLVRAFVARRYGVDLDPPSESSTVPWRHPARVARSILNYLLRVVVVLAMLSSATFAVSSWRVAHTAGVSGVVTFTNTSCAYCDWYGDFVSDDRSVVASNVDVVDAMPDAAKGSTAHVWLSTETHQAYTETGTSTWLVSGIIALLCAAYLLLVLARLLRRKYSARARGIAVRQRGVMVGGDSGGGG